MKELDPPLWLKPFVWLLEKVAGLLAFKNERGYRFPNGIPRVREDAPWVFTQEDIAVIHSQLWNGREHG